PYPFSVGGDNRTDNTWWFRAGSIYSVNLFSEYRTQAQIVEDMNRIDLSDDALLLSYDFEQSRTDRSAYHNDMQPYFYSKDFLPSEEYDYTFACIGDTQSMVKKHPDQLHHIYDFILSHAEDMKIARAIGLGDMTEDNTADQWELVSQQVFRLDNVLPYTVIRGNHDHFARTPEAEATKEAMFGYYFDNDTYRKQYDGSFDGGPTNTYTRFTVQGIPYLLLCLDYGPDDDVLNWASGIAEQYPSDNVIVATHAFLFHDGTTIDEHDICPPKGEQGFNNCDEMWDKFVSKHENIVLVLCGHDPSNEIVVSKMTGDHGNTVTSLLINPQHTDFYDRASGLVALLHFKDGGRTVTVENFSTVEGKFYKTDNEITVTGLHLVAPAS
ncbi:MAG: metallophosphoesterase, partial [Oscillospiraceae bacterium]|nr:metallophosphoesterase [Oscillospiraceae bacterium]